MCRPNDQSVTASAEVANRLRTHLSKTKSTVLIAEDDPLSARILEATLAKLEYKTITARDGVEAWKKFDREPVRVIVSDWMMPGLDGLGLCEKVRARPHTAYTYFILLSANGTNAENFELAAAAGVDDFLTKPLDRDAIAMRLRVAERILRFTSEIRRLQEMIPICVYCRRVRDEHAYWDKVESYIEKGTGSSFTHAACPDCYEKEMARLLAPPA